MDQQNNLGSRFINEPHFGNFHPNTQYRGYEEEENFPYGNPSNPQRMASQSNQYGYTNQYRGNYPQHVEDRFGPESQVRGMQAPYQTSSHYAQTNQPQVMPQYGSNQYLSSQYQGMQAQGYQQPVGVAGNQNQQYNDRDRVNDLLASEKYLTEGYNVSTFEANNPQLHNTLRNILNDTHKNRETLYHAMEQRGWYKTEQADQQQIHQAHNQFTNYKSQLPF